MTHSYGSELRTSPAGTQVSGRSRIPLAARAGSAPAASRDGGPATAGRGGRRGGSLPVELAAPLAISSADTLRYPL
jgi:hypothetical protein